MPRSSLRDRGGPLRRGFRKNTAIGAGFSPVLLLPACSTRRLFVSPVETGCDIDCPTQREAWVRLLGPAIHLRTGTLERNYGCIPSLTLLRSARFCPSIYIPVHAAPDGNRQPADH